jgi:hypothetical protein
MLRRSQALLDVIRAKRQAIQEGREPQVAPLAKRAAADPAHAKQPDKEPPP